MKALDEKLTNVQSYYRSSWGGYGCMYKIHISYSLKTTNVNLVEVIEGKLGDQQSLQNHTGRMNVCTESTHQADLQIFLWLSDHF